MNRAKVVPRTLTAAEADEAAIRFLSPSLRLPALSDRPEIEGAEPIPVTGPVGPVAAWSWGRGPAVLLVHGWEATHHDLDAFVQPLLGDGYRVIAMDLPGHGCSAGTLVPMPKLVGGVQAVARVVGPLRAIITHSLGGIIVAMALKRDVACGAAVLISVFPRLHNFFRGYTMTELGADAESVGELFGALRRLDHDPDHLDIPKLAAGIRCPALFIHSTDDRYGPIDGGKEAATAWPGGTMLEFDGLGHKRILADPTVITRTIEFLSNHLGTASKT